MIEDETTYSLRINRKPGIQTASVNFIEKWNEILKIEQKLVELLLTESVIVSKTIEDKFEEKLKETFPKNLKSIRNQIKQQSKEVVTTLETRQRKNCLTLRRRIHLHSKEHWKLSTNDTRPFPPEATTCKLMPSGDNQIATNISSQKGKNENAQESYASVT